MIGLRGSAVKAVFRARVMRRSGEIRLEKVSRLSLSQAPRDFGVCYRGFPAY